MAIQTVNLGTYANDGTGDDLRTAFTKVIDNFDYLDLIKVEDGENLGLLQPGTHGVYADVNGTTLQFKSIKQGDNVTITSDGNTITIRPVDSINAVEEDPEPQLGGDLKTNGRSIYSEDLPLEIYVKNSNFNLYAYNSTNGTYRPLNLNALTLTGNYLGAPGTSLLQTRTDDNLQIQADKDLTLTTVSGKIFIQGPLESNNIISASFVGNITGNLTGNSVGTHTGPVIGNVFGNLIGNVDGNVTGNVTGNVFGQVSDITNHNLEALANVSSDVAGLGNVLTWDGSQWVPQPIPPVTLDSLVDVELLTPSQDQILKYNGVKWVNSIVDLNLLSDVEVFSPTINQTLKYDGTKWINSASVSSIEELEDVELSAPVAGQILQYDGAIWTNAAPNFELSLSNFDLGVIGQNITNPLQLLFQALNVDFSGIDNPVSYNVDLGEIAPEWIMGAISGGAPSSSVFGASLDGGAPETSSFSGTAEGGAP